MLTTTTQTEIVRRRRVRRHAHISETVFTDAVLDTVIDSADHIAISLFGGLSTDPSRLDNLISVSNLKASILISSTLAHKPEVRDVIQVQTQLCNDIVASANAQASTQHKPTIRKTRGQTAGARGFGQ